MDSALLVSSHDIRKKSYTVPYIISAGACTLLRFLNLYLHELYCDAGANDASDLIRLRVCTPCLVIIAKL